MARPELSELHVLKGHGTENDFVLVPDLDGQLDLTPELVRALCDRHRGLGADGVLRVVRSGRDPDASQFADRAEFFMDYRNADGSLAESCGNGIRVFLHYLLRAGLVDREAAVATRGGIVSARSHGDGDISVVMGTPRILADRPLVTAASSPARTALLALTVPNPHVVVAVEPGELAALDLTSAPSVQPALPDGQNVEFVARVGPRRLRMRVHERGVGETRSCGTGICAAAIAVACGDDVGADGVPWRVDVPGGTCAVTWHTDRTVELRGPAVIVAAGTVDEAWLRSVQA